MDWKTDRRVHFAVGLVVLVLGLKWLFSDNVLFGVASLEPINQDGNVSSPMLSAWLPAIVDIGTSLLVGIGGWVVWGVLGLSSWISGKLNPAVEVGTIAIAQPAELEALKKNVDANFRKVASAIKDLDTRLRVHEPQPEPEPTPEELKAKLAEALAKIEELSAAKATTTTRTRGASK